MLKPYDGSVRVKFPNGTECWEKETITHGMESVPSYEYSEDSGLLELDYYGRVEGLAVWNEEVNDWDLVVNYFPVTEGAIATLRATIQGGWVTHSELLIPENVDEGVIMDRMLGAKGYLKIYEEVMETIMSYEGKQ